MNSSITQCPTCSTRFRVSSEQLTAHEGMVRCGRCHAVFNATEYVQNEEPAPQLNLLITLADNEKSELPDIVDEQGTDNHFLPQSGDSDFETLFQQIENTAELPGEEIVKPAPKPLRWPYTVGSLLLLTLIAAQGLYFFRVDIAARLPGTKLALLSYCDLLKCTVPLPEKLDLLSIESSDLVAEPLQPNVVTLSAILRNRAEYVQAYPNIELSFTDTQDKVLARRMFVPSEYLHTSGDEKTGMTANHELTIQLHLDSSDLRPSGYKMLLYFPQDRS